MSKEKQTYSNGKEVYAKLEEMEGKQEEYGIIVDGIRTASENTAKNVEELQKLFDHAKLIAAVSRWKTATIILLIPFVAFLIYVIIG